MLFQQVTTQSAVNHQTPRLLFNQLGKRVEGEGTPSTQSPSATTKQTISQVSTPTSRHNFTNHISSNLQQWTFNQPPTRPTHKHGHGIACSTSYDKPSPNLLSKSRQSPSPKSIRAKNTAMVKPSPR